MQIIRCHTQLAQAITGLKDKGKSIAFVPTMGALHAGHLHLVNLAQKTADSVIVSIFINPTQFNNANDLTHYPRTEQQDCDELEQKQVDIIYMPTVEDIYPKGAKTTIHIEGFDDLEGAHRPDHFNGVATVVHRLFEQVQPDYAVFGEKDWQQLQLIKTLVIQYDLPVQIIAGETMREKDGLAMSSRNVRLSAKDREIAPVIYYTLQQVKQGLTIEKAKENLLNAGIDSIDYLVHKPKENRLLIAAYLGDVRLIDNIGIF